MANNRIDINAGIYTTPEFVLVRLNKVEIITSSWELPEIPIPEGGGNSGGDNWELPEVPIPNN